MNSLSRTFNKSSISRVSIREHALSQTRSYAKPSKPVGGDKDDNVAPLGPFQMKAPRSRLPNVRGYDPVTLELKPHPRHTYGPQTLLRSIDVEHRQRMDQDERTRMFAKISPHRVVPGTILLVETVQSRSNPKKNYIAGIVTAIKRSGVTTRVELQCRALGVPFKCSFPIYSPMVSRFLILQSFPEKLRREDQELPDEDASYAENPSLIDIDYDAIETMLSRHKMYQQKHSS